MSLGFSRPIIAIEPTIIGHVFGFPIANSTLFQIIIVIIVAAVGYQVARAFSASKPQGFQILLEATYEAVVSYIKGVVGSETKAARIFPLAGAIMIFVLLQNVLALLPGIGSITLDGESLLRTPTADFNTTLGLAIVSVVVIHAATIADFGVMGYIGNYIKIGHVFRSFKKSFSDGAMSLVDMFIGLLDIVGEIAKVLSLSLRLFGNLYAGEVLMGILIGILAFAVPGVWLLMSTLSAVVQAIVFTSLVSVFFGLAIRDS